ncbi:hypothetical protein M885DRAFT_620946 [Pelagophyceae sp. CCMP2097]|nr:hypothetical protein M885DRAFT_620946 [Pelagophyceae sp. CCMP2097]
MPVTPSKRSRGAAAPAPVTASAKKTPKKAAASGPGAARRLALDDADEARGKPATDKLIGYTPAETLHDVPAPKRAVFEFVCHTVAIPADFEHDHAYGPKSGVTHEDRVIAAYVHDMLDHDDDAFRRQLKKLVAARAWPAASAACAHKLAAAH